MPAALQEQEQPGAAKWQLEPNASRSDFLNIKSAIFEKGI
jgi:hypothetical protein